ncbi:MAG: TolC family protein [Bacteroidaceae bacterium]|nr:TolC family protein [Bacteroidaceae bacterium]
MKKQMFLWVMMMTLGSGVAAAQQLLSLDSCRAMAIRNNKELQMSALKQEAAHWQRKSALSNYFPRVTAVGSYQRTSKEISLLSDEQKDKLNNLGTNMAGKLQSGLQQGMQGRLANLQQQWDAFKQSPQFMQMLTDPAVQQWLAQNPSVAQMLASPTMVQDIAAPYVQRLSTAFNGMLSGMSSMLDETGQGIVDAFHTDTRNLMGVSVLLTQPLYMGGKIRAYDKITRLAEEAAQQQYSMEEQDLLVSVDEAYWRIVALQSKKQLAESFLATVKKLDQDVEKVIAEGMATKADGLSVKVKMNEAEVAVIQVDNGLELSRMALAQLCGLPLDAAFTLADEGQGLTSEEAESLSASIQTTATPENAVETALSNRAELRALDIAAQVKQQQVRVALSEYMPNLALTAGYLATNPNLYNGFQKKFGGAWNVGVVLKVPIITWGDRIYKVRQAKAEAAMARLRYDEASEKISLQVNQNRQKLQEAQRRLVTATRSQEQADENLRMANLGMSEGVIPVSNVLQAQTAWLSAHSTLVEAEIDVRLADLYLQRALGTLQ